MKLSQQAAPPNIVITKPELLLQRQISSQAQGHSHLSSPQVMTTVSMVTKTATVATSASGGSVTVASSTQPSSNPLMARLVQQMSGGHMLSVSDLLAAQRLQGAQPRVSAPLKIGMITSFEPRHEKIRLRGFRQIEIQTSLLRYRYQLNN